MAFKFNQLVRGHHPFYVGLWVIISYLKMAMIVGILKVLYSIPRLKTAIARLRRRNEKIKLVSDADFIQMQLECTTLRAWRGLSCDMKKFCQIAVELTEQVDFLAVYVEEAHPDDGNNLSYKSGFEVMQAKVLEERLASATAMVQHLG
ncbi:hypothetical protein CAPTEDRAFT_191743, partial [Capitella teleta]